MQLRFLLMSCPRALFTLAEWLELILGFEYQVVYSFFIIWIWYYFKVKSVLHTWIFFINLLNLLDLFDTFVHGIISHEFYLVPDCNTNTAKNSPVQCALVQIQTYSASFWRKCPVAPWAEVSSQLGVFRPTTLNFILVKRL